MTLWDEIKPFTSQLHGRVLDIGCGNGDYANRLSKLPRITSVLSVDIEKLPFAWDQRFEDNRSKDDFVWCNMERLPFKDNAFDCVFALHCIEHCPNPMLALREMSRVCNDLCYVALPTRGGAWDSEGHLWVWEPEDFYEDAYESGLYAESTLPYIDQCKGQNWMFASFGGIGTDDSKAEVILKNWRM